MEGKGEFRALTTSESAITIIQVRCRRQQGKYRESYEKKSCKVNHTKQKDEKSRNGQREADGGTKKIIGPEDMILKT